MKVDSGLLSGARQLPNLGIFGATGKFDDPAIIHVQFTYKVLLKAWPFYCYRKCLKQNEYQRVTIRVLADIWKQGVQIEVS